MRSRDPPTGRPRPTIASRVSNSQPPLALAWHCASALGGASKAGARECNRAARAGPRRSA